MELLIKTSKLEVDPLREVDENKSISINYMIVVYQNIL